MHICANNQDKHKQEVTTQRPFRGQTQMNASRRVSLGAIGGYLFQWLSMDGGVNWAGFKLVQILAQQLQALVRWVITIEPETRIAGVIVPAVKVLRQVAISSESSQASSKLSK